MTRRRDFTLGAGAALASAFLDASTASAAAAAAPVGVTKEKAYRLVKNWDFATAIRDPKALREEFHTRYIYGDGSLDHLNDEWSRYRDRDNHVFTDHGLSLVARVAGGLRPGSVESGMLRSRWSGQYGVFEIRMQVPRGRGFWPAFWLNPEDKRWPPEIDVVEIVDNGRDTTKQSFHFLHGVGQKKVAPAHSKLDQKNAYCPGFDYADGFHVFSVEWTQERVRHLVDGVLVTDREYAWRHDDGTDAGPAHVLVNLAVGGKWAGPPGHESFPGHLTIDYMRVWQR